MNNIATGLVSLGLVQEATDAFNLHKSGVVEREYDPNESQMKLLQIDESRKQLYRSKFSSYYIININLSIPIKLQSQLHLDITLSQTLSNDTRATSIAPLNS